MDWGARRLWAGGVRAQEGAEARSTQLIVTRWNGQQHQVRPGAARRRLFGSAGRRALPKATCSRSNNRSEGRPALRRSHHRHEPSPSLSRLAAQPSKRNANGRGDGAVTGNHPPWCRAWAGLCNGAAAAAAAAAAASGFHAPRAPAKWTARPETAVSSARLHARAALHAVVRRVAHVAFSFSSQAKSYRTRSPPEPPRRPL